MVALTARLAFSYAGTSLSAGDRFLASDRDAKILIVTQRADVAPALRTSAQAAESDTDLDVPRPKRRYRRRDLVPEP